MYLLSFTGILLLLIWFFQTVYLDRFYKIIKKSELDKAAQTVKSILNKEDIEDEAEAIADKYDICILITDSSGNEMYSAESLGGCFIHRMSKTNLIKIYKDAVENGGNIEINETQIKKYDVGFEDNKDIIPKGPETFSDKRGESPGKVEKSPKFPEKSEVESIIRVMVVYGDDGEEYVIFLNSVISPVEATVHTIRIQLICISAIMIVLSLIIALLISKRVSKSIIVTNESAKELAKGNFDVEFGGKDYREIAELSDTLNRTAKELAKTDILQKELIANVSHDLRTPLTMIVAYSEVMRDIPGENTPENVQVIIDETQRLTYLVNDLLDMSKLQAGVTSLEMKLYDITASINAVVERYSKMLESYEYEVIYEFDRHVLVEADEFKIYQVVYNLIANAVNYTGCDKTIKVKQIVENSMVRIEVIDTGEGIPEDKLENVWERYYKVDKNHKRAIMGSGIGLSIVKNILILHNAKYGVDSEEGKGSTFWFELPITEEDFGKEEKWQ